ncbi:MULTISPECIES: hypothetical protein [Thalassospira]|jgi:hypothetical protein|uniref:Uncharacterized protein n=2 Tax=Thalassospira TaxID=168934 RepID=A0ABR5Y2V4_9PROT|nr:MULTISPECIES: hypothetical protein [Thalassospira]MAL30468.1 hypothetical protein [Thalassospira sp.]MBR9780098.1 hypothetical protein [Rhodospirillales bacterium]KEO56710.1 hypothetical protein SMB34_19040 [Thalassospira permensis NBRC 106175]KZD04574.1 hypothetical protein AUP40_15230 [Thalassospira xiamenensis]KZD10415.1 hypothetical protein AUP45_11545 [Thalassospira xiamenensis]|tara:strand:- start:9992 stop:10411 length:420 start_codon:yes stop_codon:yes gene_type:complete
MTITRNTHRTVTFFHPFRLEGYDELFQAGTYEVETLEELDLMAATRSYKKVQSNLHVWSRDGKTTVARLLVLDPVILDSALVLDADPLREEERARMIGTTGKDDDHGDADDAGEDDHPGHATTGPGPAFRPSQPDHRTP